MKIKLFNENHLNSDFQKIFETASRTVKNLSEKELTINSSEELANRIFKTLEEKDLVLDLSNKEAKVEMINISGKTFPQRYDVERSKDYSCARITYKFNIISDNSKYLSSLPPQNNFQPVNAEVYGNKELHIYYQTLYGNIELNEQTKKEVKNWIIDLVPKIENIILEINKNIAAFNLGLKPIIKELIDKRVTELSFKNKQNNDLADF